MPLLKSNSKKAISFNIKEMMKAGHPKDQSISAALSTARKYARKAEGGSDLEDPRMKAIGIRPVEGTPNAPEQPVQAPPEQGSWGPPVAAPAPDAPPDNSDIMQAAYLKALTESTSPPPEPPSFPHEKPLSEGRRGPWTRAIEGAKHVFEGTKDLGMSGEFLAKHPGWLPFQPIAAAGDLALKGMSAGIHGIAGLAGGVAEDLGNPSWGDRMERDVNVMGQAPELGPSTIKSAGAVTGRALDVGMGLLPENAAAAGLSKLKQPDPGKFFHPYDFNPEELKGVTPTGPQQGSTPGGMYQMPNGEPVYIKTPENPEQAYSEKLATELYRAAGVQVPENKMTKFKGKPSIVSPVIPGQALNTMPDISQVKGLAEHYPIDLWLGNSEWNGAKNDKVIVTPHNEAYRLNMGAALSELKPTVHNFYNNPSMWKIMGGQPSADWTPAADRLRAVTDQQIHDLVEKYGPMKKGMKPKLEETLKARRDEIATMYGTEEVKPSPLQDIAAKMPKKKGPEGDLGDLSSEMGDLIKSSQSPPKANQPLGVSAKSFQDDVRAFDPTEKWNHYDALHDTLAGQQLGLNQGQKEAVSYWTNPAGYKDLNGYLRGVNKSQTAAELVPELDSAMAAHPLQQDTVAWRGLHGPHADQLIGLKEGDTFFNAGYTATTIDPRRATHYGKKNDPGIILNYHMPAGSEGLYTSHPDAGGWSTAERELLLPHGQGFKITGIEKIKAPIWDYTGAVSDANPHNFTVYHVEPIWGSAGTQLDAVKGATPVAPAGKVWGTKTAPAKLFDNFGNSPEEKAKAIITHAKGDLDVIDHNVDLNSKLYGDEYGKAVEAEIQKQIPPATPKKYTWNGMTLADPDKMANVLMKTPGKIDDKIAELKNKYGQEYAHAVAEAHDDAIIKKQVEEFKANDYLEHDTSDYAYDDDMEPPEHITSEDLSGSGHKELKFQGKPWFGKNTKEQVVGEWDTHRIEQEMKKGDGVIQILNNKQWVDEYRPPTKKNHQPVSTPNAISDPAEGGFNQFVEFHHNTPDKGPSGYLEKVLHPKNKHLASGTTYSGEQALYGLDYPFKGYNYHQTGPYLMNPEKVAVAYWPNFFGQTLGKIGNNGLGATGFMQKKIIKAAHDQGVDLVVLHGMNDVGGINQTQYLVINNKILRAKDAKFDPAKFNASAIDPATGHEYSHTMWGIAGASAVGAGLIKGQKGEDDKMARGGKVKFKPFSSIENLTGLDEGYRHKPYGRPGAGKKAVRTAKKYAEGGAAGNDYNTALSPEDEARFQIWKQQNMPNDSGADYDQRGAYLAQFQQQANGHWQDQFKKPNHPTFSDQSQYAVGDQRDRAGSWNGDQFIPPANKKRGGKVADSEPQDHEFINFAKGGMINSNIPGRTDKIPMKVATGAYVLPADIPSALGQGNTIAGKTILDKMFNSGPYGLPLAKGRSQKFQMPRLPHLKGFSQFAEGGETDHTPIIAAGGEYILSPDKVMNVGNGSMTTGHKILDAFTLQVRKDHIKTLKGLKGPK